MDDIRKMIGSSRSNIVSQQTREFYKKMGEEYFKGIKVTEDNQVLTELDVSVYQIVVALKSGLLFEDLAEDELRILESYYGKDWKERVSQIVKNA